MKKLRERKIFSLLCRTYKFDNGEVNWYKIANELRKLDSYKKKFKVGENICDKCGK